ncbi:hypothetical protein [Acetobacter aceti]|uniref:Uncharacterized protein n=1 Tax=Acetobacter aceti TaxID=435 RepID=A0A6S6PL64_ACEAC|nr:hypothetical protein [Acetobacter aceti]BCI65492.1 hypothetical protein AAJCM20276_01160 [Acetobacter aceti]
MMDAVSTYGLGSRQLACFGLMHPVANEPWNVAERSAFHLAAGEVWRTDGPLTVIGCPHLAKAREIVNRHVPDWWSSACVVTGLDREGCASVIDLALPILWGANWLSSTLETLPESNARDTAAFELYVLFGVISERLEDLRQAELDRMPCCASARVWTMP